MRTFCVRCIIFAFMLLLMVAVPSSSGLRTTDLPRRELHLDPRLLELGLKLRRLLLGSWDLGAGAGGRFFVDSGLLGLGRQRICFL